MTDQYSNEIEFSAALLAPRYWLLWIWFGILWLVSRLPYRAMCAVGRGVGRTLYHLLSGRRKIALDTIAACFPEMSKAEQVALAKASFAEMGITLFESGIVWWTKPERAEKIFRISGVEKVNAAVARGERVLLAIPHMTCVELAVSRLAVYFPFVVLYRVHNNPVFEYVSGRGRAQFQIVLFPRKRVADFLQRMHEGSVGAVAPDQDMGPKRSVFVPYFNKTAATITAVSDYARETGARVALIDAYRTDDHRVNATIGDFLDDFPTDDVVADTARLNILFENMIREHPEQYVWAHRRFKTRPENVSELD